MTARPKIQVNESDGVMGIRLQDRQLCQKGPAARPRIRSRALCPTTAVQFVRGRSFRAQVDLQYFLEQSHTPSTQDRCDARQAV